MTLESDDFSKYEKVQLERSENVDKILQSTSRKKVVVAGPGTGKTFLFKKVLKGKTNTLTLSFVNSLVEDLSLDLYGLSEVKTLHSYGRSMLATLLKRKIKIYSKLSNIISDDFKILNGSEIDFDVLFRNRQDDDKRLEFYELRRHYYDYYGFTDVIYAAVTEFESDKSKIPTYQYVLIDEFQDFNKLEVSLIDLLAEKSSILLAGDDDQALYEDLKNASAQYIRLRYNGEMKDYESFTLPYCSRCPDVIVQAANDLIRNSKQHGFLKDRIDKPYLYFPDAEKDKVSKQFPLISYSIKFSKQIPWFIEKCIAETANFIKSKFDVLIITSNNTQVRSIAKALIDKGFRNLHYPDRVKEREISLLEAYNMLIVDKQDNLAWRIISSLLLPTDNFNSLIYESNKDVSKKFCEFLSPEFKKGILEQTKVLKYIVNNKPVNPELLTTIFTQLGINTEKLSTDHLLNEFVALNPANGDPALRNIPIKITTIQSSKGLAADIVILANFDDKYFLREKNHITDQDICNFIVALTRTKKKAFIISSDSKSTPSLLNMIAKERIQYIK